MLGLTAQQLLEQATARTGLTDLGDDAFLPTLDQLVRSIDRESTLTNEGRTAAQERYIRVLSNRLRFTEDLKRHPEILDTRLLPPVIICGLPRVGSTKLHRLLAESQDFQALIFWQGFNPAPFPNSPADGPDPRIAAAVEFLAWRARSNPATNAGHYMAALEPEEDTYLLEYTLLTYWPTSYFEVRSFLAWLKTQNRDRCYEYVRKLLQYLQWQFHRDRPRPWVLKSPPNLGYEDLMAKHLPGARFVVLHRDPVEVIPSTAAIVREVRRLYCGAAPDVKQVGTWAIEQYADDMSRHMAWRKNAPPDSILDLPYSAVRDDDIDAVRRVYEFCGMTLSAEAEARMREWSRENSQHMHGVHEYSLDEAGLTAEQIEHQFKEYIERFGTFMDR
ncbi:MAG: sulfotransferase [Steroidobacteraceae bacterium]